MARTGSWTEALTADMPRDLAVLPRDARRATTGAAETAEREAIEAEGARARGGRAAAGARTIDEAKTTSACASARDVPGWERRGVEWREAGTTARLWCLGLSIRTFAQVAKRSTAPAVFDDSDTGEQSAKCAKNRHLTKICSFVRLLLRPIRTNRGSPERVPPSHTFAREE